MQGRFTAPAKAQIAGARGAEHDRYHGLHLCRIPRGENRYPRQGTKHCHVFRCMVAHAQAAVNKTAAYAHNFHIGIVIGAVVANLLQAPQGRKVADGISQHRSPFPCKACRQAGHGLFRNACVDKLIRISFPERLQHAEAQVARHQRQFRISGGFTHQGSGKCISHGRCASNSFSAASYSSP